MKSSGVRRVGAILTLLLTAAAAPSAVGAEGTAVPEPGKSKMIDAIKARGTLKAAAIGEFPWLPENTTGSGEPFSGPAWMLAEAFASRLGVTLEVVPVSHETKVPILATGEADLTIAPLAVTEAREKVVDFVVYSKYSVCLFGRADNPKLQDVGSMDELDRPDITMAYFTGTPPETWAPARFPNMTLKGVSGVTANAPVEEILANRADIAPIDNVAWPQLDAAVPGLISFPPGDECLQSTEQAAPVGLAINKGDPIFLEWLLGVAAEMKEETDAEELKLLKGN
jgi:polar amino acid transport system substrate-binding protein